jgi:hypothetical protein
MHTKKNKYTTYPRPLKVRNSYVLFCNIYVYTPIKNFQKNGKRKTKAQTHEVPQVRQEDKEANRPKPSDP